MRRVLSLVSGSIAGQALTLLTFPIVTRLNSPHEFGEFQIAIGFCNALGFIAALSLERSLYLVQHDKRRRDIETLCVMSVIAISLASGLLYPLFGAMVSGAPKFLMGVPVAILAMFYIACRGLYLVLYTKSIIFNKIKSAAISVFSRDVGRISTRLIIGSGPFQPLGLMLSGIADWLTGLILFGFLGVRFRIHRLKLTKIFCLIRRYKRFPLYFAPTSLIGVFVSQIPVFMIGSLFSTKEAGLFSAGFVLIDRPSRILAKAVGDLVSRDVGLERKADGGAVLRASKRRVYVMIGVAFPFFLALAACLYFFAEQILGAAWGGAGLITVCAVPYVLSLFIDELSLGLYSVSGGERILLIKQLISGSVLLSCFFLGAHYNFNLNAVVLLSGLVCFFMQIVFLSRVSRTEK